MEKVRLFLLKIQLKWQSLCLKLNYFGFKRKVKQQVSGTAIGITFAPTYGQWLMQEFNLGHGS